MNRESYDAIAVQWEQARVHLGTAETRMIDMVLDGIPQGGRILDLGCGTGRPIAEYVASRGLCITGVDQSSAMLSFARARLPNHAWILATIEDFQPVGIFAGAIVWDSLFHIPRVHHAPVLRRVRSALGPNAKIALTVGGSVQPAFTDEMFDRTFFYDSYPPDAAIALLEAEGYSVVQHEFLNLPTAGRDKGRVVILATAN